MSQPTITEPEVLTGHTDIICSTSIERIITGRNSALKVSVQHEPSGHNLKHPTKWCPPNK